MTVQELIDILEKYPKDVKVSIYDRAMKKNRKMLYCGASPNDENAWYDDEEIPSNASYVEILI